MQSGSLLILAAMLALPARAAEADYLQLAKDYADCMIRYGRDRYGKVRSPLFANALTREKEPKLPPYPLFAAFADPAKNAANRERDQAKKRSAFPGVTFTGFVEFDFNKCLNYPPELNGDEGPHKVTIYGCDPFEERDIYLLLTQLSRITGEPGYQAEADKALRWWFQNTQSPQTGLYPWGEHLGWDFQYDAPTYFFGPSMHLYAASFHEIKDRVPFLEYLIPLPPAKAGEYTPLERYALGIWKAHFWDKDRAFFCRHGDYLGVDNRRGSAEGFPAHLGAYLQVWATAYLHSQNASCKNDLAAALSKTADMALQRTETHGFFPFTFDAELNGQAVTEKAKTSQSTRLAEMAREVGRQLREPLPEVAAKLDRLAFLHLGAALPAPPAASIERPKADVRPRDLSHEKRPDACAGEIVKWVKLYTEFGDRSYLDAALTCAGQARARFLDDQCPLPRAFPAEVRLRTKAGEPFPDVYYRGAKLMNAFALLGEAQRRERAK